MKTLYFAKRNLKEIIRDPLTLAFGIGFPIILLLLLSLIQTNIPINMFEIEHLSPGICVFGLSFMTLFSATLIAKDRETAFLTRLYTTPLTATDFILGYTLPVLPLSIAQNIVCFVTASFLGLKPNINVFYCIIFIIPISIFYIALGLLFGSILNVKQAGGICGALLTNLSAWVSGIWFDVELMGNGFKKIANLLPFIHSVNLERAVLKGNFNQALTDLSVILIYTVVFLGLAIHFFLKGMEKG